jgi:ribonuclease T1
MRDTTSLETFGFTRNFEGKSMAFTPGIKLVIARFLFVVALVWGAGITLAQAKGPDSSSINITVSLSELPQQGVETYKLIRQGGPFPFEKDGVVFGNRERLLPQEKRGFYREYTVKTPGSRDRGARRIVCGGQATTPDVCFYTADHYASFRKIVP